MMYETDLNLLKSTRSATLSMTSMLTDEQASARPGPGEWSVNQVLEHLLISEKLYRDTIGRLIAMQREGKRPLIVQSLADINTGLPFVPRALMTLMDFPLTVMNLFVPGFVREQMMQVRSVKAKSPTIAQPTSGKPLADLRDALAQSVVETGALFAANKDIDFRKLHHSHPAIGFNNVLQIIRIVAVHEKRHQAQIQEILQRTPVNTAA